MNEFDLIKHYFDFHSTSSPDLLIDNGDDAAVIQVPTNCNIAISTDTLVSGVHFLPEWPACSVAQKAWTANASDMAAMGAKPRWLSLALTLPKVEPDWLKLFSETLKTQLTQHQVVLIGGDTTKGPLSITMTIHGLLPKNYQLARNGARPGDIVYVSGSLGAPGAAVKKLQESQIDSWQQPIFEKLMYPKPQIALSQMLLAYASSAVDISDGVLADLGHVLQASAVSVCLEAEKIPISKLLNTMPREKALTEALYSGDEYELCFTIPPKKQKAFELNSKQAGFECTVIGSITPGDTLPVIKLDDGQLHPLKLEGFRHF